jgi:hypothetical protein
VSISLDGLLRFLGNADNDKASEGMAIRLIEMYGLAFRPTPEDLNRLRKAFASEDLVRVVETAKVPPPPPKPVAKQGELTITCQPVDCDVRVNGTLIGSTTNGALSQIILPAGSVTVSAARLNYDPDISEHELLIRPDQTAAVQFAFKPSRAALVTVGTKLFQQMIDSLGRPMGEGEIGVLRSAGTIYLHNGTGRVSVWSVVTWLRDPDVAKFEFTRLRERHQITPTGAGFLWNRTRRPKQAQELEDAIRLAVAGQLSKIVEHLKDPHLTMVAFDLRPENEMASVFRAEGGPDTYVIRLDSAHRPSEIKLESAGLPSGLRIMYSDYTEQGGTWYPQTIQVILPDGVRGIEARFDTVRIDRDYLTSARSHSK